MLESPFGFLRGSAIVMARDLASTPVTGVSVHCCGDAHLDNFGIFASPERNLLFDVNDFDETFPGPWEWDVKRLATSAVVAGRCGSCGDSGGAEAARSAVRSYREWINKYAEMGILEVWYSRVDAEGGLKLVGEVGRDTPLRSALSKAQRHTSAAALPHLTELTRDGQRRIVDHPPLVTHDEVDEHSEMLDSILASYLDSLEDERRALVGQFKAVDFALKVVGVGSVGTRCFIALLLTDRGEALLLQVKEADRSVLEDSLGPVRPGGPMSQGRRVVIGQRMLQAASDIFLGWSTARGVDYYVRQLRDMKGSVDFSAVGTSDFVAYLELCGWTLARAHARSGVADAIATYVGSGEVFDDAIVEFARAYADQAERDHAELVDAVTKGRVEADTSA